MGLFSFLKKQKNCTRCSIQNGDAKIFGYDPTNRGELDGEAQDLCLNHLREVWLKDLESTQIPTVAFMPVKGWNSYSYCQTEDLGEWAIEDYMVEQITPYLDQIASHKCELCELKSGVYLFNAPIDGVGEILSDTAGSYVCYSHFIESVLRAVEAEDMSLDEINIPYGDGGVYMQGEL